MTRKATDPDRVPQPDSPRPAATDLRWILPALEPLAGNVAHTRHAAGVVLVRWEAQRFEWSLLQLLSEVATNAVLHAGTSFDVELAYDGTRMRCEVSDSSLHPPRPLDYGIEAGTGRGLRILTALASSWGVLERPAGKTVWFELRACDLDKDETLDLDLFLSPEDVADLLPRGSR